MTALFHIWNRFEGEEFCVVAENKNIAIASHEKIAIVEAWSEYKQLPIHWQLFQNKVIRF